MDRLFGYEPKNGEFDSPQSHHLGNKMEFIDDPEYYYHFDAEYSAQLEKKHVTKLRLKYPNYEKDETQVKKIEEELAVFLTELVRLREHSYYKVKTWRGKVGKTTEMLYQSKVDEHYNASLIQVPEEIEAIVFKDEDLFFIRVATKYGERCIHKEKFVENK